MNYIQTLFSIFNAPLFATFIVAMFWKRATRVGRLLEPGRRDGDRVRGQPAGRLPRDLPLRLGAERELLAGDLGVHRRRRRARAGLAGDQAQAARRSCAGWSGASRARRSARSTPTRATSCGGARRRCSAASRSRIARRPEHHLHLGAARELKPTSHSVSRARRQTEPPAPTSDEEEVKAARGGEPVRHPPADRRAVHASTALILIALGHLRLRTRSRTRRTGSTSTCGPGSGCSCSAG